MLICLVMQMGILSQPHAEHTLLFFSAERFPGTTEYNSVYKVDLSEGSIDRIYTSDNVLRTINHVEHPKLVVVHVLEPNSGYREVHIIDLEGNVVKILKYAVSAAFLGNSESRVAFTKGYLDEDRESISLGTWLYDFKTGDVQQICSNGLYLEWAPFSNSMYIRSSGTAESDFLYNCDSTEIKEIDNIRYGGFSPNGEYRWQYKTVGGVEIRRRVTGDSISTDFKILNTRHHGTPPQWLNDRLIMLPHAGREIEEYLLFVETGRTLKTPGRILSITDDEKYVYLCMPELEITKVAIDDLKMLYEGEEKPDGDSGSDSPATSSALQSAK